MNKTENQVLAVIVNGVCDGKAFKEAVVFRLEKSGAFKYGSGLMMIVNRLKYGEESAVDVRYEKTKDLKKLADAWLNGFFGENMTSYEVLPDPYHFAE